MGRTYAGLNLFCETVKRNKEKYEVIQNWLIDSESQNTSCFDVFWFDCDPLQSSVVSIFHPSNLLSCLLCSVPLGHTLAQIPIECLTVWPVHSRASFPKDMGLKRSLKRCEHSTLLVSPVHSECAPSIPQQQHENKTTFILKSTYFSKELFMQEI